MRTQTPLRAAMLAASLVLGAPALAGEFDSMPPIDPATVALATAPQASLDVLPDAPIVPVDPAFGTAVPTDRLDGMRGGDGNTSTTSNRADLRGTVDGNSATNVIAGGNLVADGSFGNAAGISTVIQNSGSNVLIQNSTIVNVQFVPTP